MHYMHDELITVLVPASAKVKYPDLERRFRALRKNGGNQQRQLVSVLKNLNSTEQDGHEIASRELKNE